MRGRVVVLHKWEITSGDPCRRHYQVIEVCVLFQKYVHLARFNVFSHVEIIAWS